MDTPGEKDPGKDGGGSAKPPLAVVGIGASAGGFEAMRSFLLAMPPDSGLCFVYIQHLAPDYKSLMAELLARFTKMRVAEAVDGMALEPNLVLVAPPNRYVAVVDDHLRLTEPIEPRGVRLPIDFFLQSLAHEKREAVIGIILSGAGSDGVLGVKAIKECGGMVLAEEAAAYDTMPRTAIETGHVDCVLPTAKMPEMLLAFASHDYVTQSNRAKEYSQDTFIRIMNVIKTHTKRNFKEYKKKTVIRRIERRMGLNRINDMEVYVEFLRNSSVEIAALAKDLLISVTNFFRDSESFESLRREVLVPLVLRASPERPLRVWVAGCATGEEAYSVAMLLIEAFSDAGREYAAQIFATDIDTDALEVARTGLYPESIEADVSPTRLARFFTKEGIFYRVTKQLRESVMFAVQNLLTDPPFSKMDLITCRNLLIYIEPDVQKSVLSLFHFVLTEGGALMLGSSETIGRLTNHFEPISKKDRIYRRVGATLLSHVQFPLLAMEERGGVAVASSHAGTGREPLPAELARQVLLEQYAPASVLVNRRGQVLYFYGDTTKYLEFPTGEPSQDLIAIARDGLRTKLRAALHRAIQSDEEISIGGVRLRRNGGYCQTRFRVVPLQRFRGTSGLLLVSFTDEPEAQPEQPGAGEHPDKDDGAIRHLESELQATKEDLQSTIEELETSNEELKASNEEIMSINEELQSSNEELETSKEELQSLNEELTTVNSQLHDKVDELETTTNDLVNLLSSTDLATIFLDTELRIKRFTPSINRLFNLIPSDIGRPVSDISQKFYDDSLLPDLKAVLAKLVPVEKEIATMDGGYCIRRILPYRTQDNRIEGAVVTFTDITQLKTMSERLELRAQRGGVVIEIGQHALSGVEPDSLHAMALQAVAETLKTDLVCLFQPGTEGQDLHLCGHHGEPAALPPLTVGKDGAVDVGYVFWARDSLLVRDFSREKRLRPALRAVRPDIASCIATVIDGRSGPAGVLVAYACSSHHFSDDDVEFLRAIANLLGMASERRQAQLEIEAARDALAEAKVRAEQASDAKTRFLAAASHDLRQPVQAASLFHGALVSANKDKKLGRIIENLGSSLHAIGTLLESLLNISKLDAGVIRIEKRTLPLDEVLQPLAARTAALAEAKGLQLRYVPTRGAVHTDPELLAQMVQNLLSNAIRYTERGKILVGCRHRGRRLDLAVCDTGIGIPEGHLASIFAEFYQVSNEARQSSKGLGLGLSIVERIARLLDCPVSVRSTEGKGSIFIVSIPLADRAVS